MNMFSHHLTAKAELLRSVPMLAHLSRRHLEALCRIFDEATLPAGRVLFRQGGLAREFALVVGGEARVERDGRTIGAVGPGDIVGELALLGAHARTATVTATTDLHLLVGEARTLAAFLEEAPEIAVAVAHHVAHRVEGLAAA